MLDEAEQTPFEMVHINVCVPVIKLETLELLSAGVATLEPPSITVHNPVPTVGLFPVNVKLEAHRFCEGPAFDVVGLSSTKIVTEETDDKQGTLEMVQSKILAPIPKPVIALFGEVGLVIIPLPETKVHSPVPTVGVFAAIVVVGEEMQSVCVGPALEAVGISFTISATVAVDAKQGGFEMVQANTFVPKPKPVMFVLGRVGLLIVPLPEIKVHIPVPMAGVLEAILVVGEEMQSI